MTKTLNNVVTATRFSSSDYEKNKEFSSSKRLKLSKLLRKLVLEYIETHLKIQT